MGKLKDHEAQTKPGHQRPEGKEMDQLDLIHALEPKRGRDTNPLVKPPQNFAVRKVINGGSNRHVLPETHRKQEPGIRDTTNDERNLAQHRQNRSSPEALKPPETKRVKEAPRNRTSQNHQTILTLSI